MTWNRRDIERRMQRFRQQCRAKGENGALLKVTIVRADQMRLLIDAGDAGDIDARDFMRAFVHWDQMINDTGEQPGCMTCGKPIRRGGVGAFALIRQRDKRAMGACGAFCVGCATLSQENLWRALRQQLAEDMGGEISDLH